MSQPIDLNAIERKAFASQFQDGLNDIQLGLLLLGVWAIRLATFNGDSSTFREVMPIFLVYWIVVGAIPWLGRRWITSRRMGTMKPGPERRAKFRKIGWILALIVAIQVFLILLQTLGIVHLELGRVVMASFVGLIVFVPMALIAHRNDFFRGYLQALLVGVTVTLILMFDSGIPLFISGAVITLMGLIIFIRFMIQHPIPDNHLTPEEG